MLRRKTKNNVSKNNSRILKNPWDGCHVLKDQKRVQSSKMSPNQNFSECRDKSWMSRGKSSSASTHKAINNKLQSKRKLFFHILKLKKKLLS